MKNKKKHATEVKVYRTPWVYIVHGINIIAMMMTMWIVNINWMANASRLIWHFDVEREKKNTTRAKHNTRGTVVISHDHLQFAVSIREFSIVAFE